MTINHVFIRVTSSRFAAVRNFYTTALQPLGYREMLTVDPNSFVGIGSDYPYIFLKAFPEGDANLPTHIAIDAKTTADVDAFHAAGLAAGGKDHGAPRIHQEMSVQPYYSGFVLDPDGNNVEAVNLPPRKSK